MARTAAARLAKAETLRGEDLGPKIEQALRGEGGASLLLTDLDSLMILNEKAGREAGDAAIRAALRVLKAAAEHDGYALARVGGDEFALLAPSLPLEQAFLRAERLRSELNAALAKAVPRGYTCTATIGVANAPRDAKNAEQLMRKADMALYAAKEQGGNAVGLTPADDMVLRSSYYSVAQLGRLRALAERQKKKEAVLLREALDDLLRKHERS
jgi:diguanylate cyclase (GGDEF)-like protein